MCRLMVEDLAFETRRAAGLGGGGPGVSKDAVRTKVASHFENVCQNAYYRRPLKRDDVDLCEDIIDDHRELILDTYLKARGGGKNSGAGGQSSSSVADRAWLEVAQKVCVEEAELCKPNKVTAENFPLREEL